MNTNKEEKKEEEKLDNHTIQNSHDSKTHQQLAVFVFT
jgi:hypothetical protein